MQSLGDNTLAAFLNTDSVILTESNNRKLKKSFGAPTTRITSNSEVCPDNSDIGKYFKDSIVFFTENTINNSNKESNDDKPSLDIVKVSKKSNHDEEIENFNGSLELTQRNQIYTRKKLKKKISQENCENAPSDPPKKKLHKNVEPLQQISWSCDTNIITLQQKSSLQKNYKFINVDSNDDNSRNYNDLLKCSKVSLNHELSSLYENSSIKSTVQIPSIITTQDRVKLAYWGLPLTILRKYESRGVSCMFQWQVECLRNPQIIEKYKNLIYSAPTSAGKTLVSEILVIKTVLERRKKVIFVLPFVSVVREKMYYFQDLLMDSGVKVDGFMSGIHPPGGFTNTDVAIATIEKANSLINQLMENDELENVGAVVIDELHLLGDSHRGYLLELLLTKLKYMNLRKEHVHIQLIGMSATLPNLSLLANWLDAELYKTDFRPVPLKELCKIGSKIYDDKLNIIRDLNPLPQLPSDPDNVLQLCYETICDGHSVLIFCPTKNWCENLAQQISNAFFQIGRNDTIAGRTLRNQLNAETILETLEQLKRTPVGLDRVLRSTVSFGVAFHHAGLTMDERDVIEGAFRSGALRVLTATSTLSSGVNLPARRVIVRTPIFHGKAIDTLTYKQMIGRAGRMGKDTAGESILVCKPCEKSTAINILNSSLQPIESCLEGSSPLIRALLEAIASEVAYTHDDIATYMKCTLLSFTNQANEVELSTKQAVDFLVQNELLLFQKTEDGIPRWVATPLGKACLAASVPPKDGLFLFEELQKARQCFVLDTELHVIYLVTPFNSGSQIGQIDWYVFLDLWKSISESERRVGQLIGIKESYLMSALQGVPKPGKTLDIHKRFYTALALHDLVREVPLHAVCKKYNCCRGVIQSLQQTASTFAGMVTQFCKKLGWNCIELLVSQFQARLQFGVSRELLDLLRLPMLNGLRARSLYKEGITNVTELAIANELDVERALYKALPFESEKKQVDEDENEAARRNKMRTVFVTGKDGLTPRMAAMMLVKEARTLVQNELGLEELPWNKKNQSNHEHDIDDKGSLSTKLVATNQVDDDTFALSRVISLQSNSSNNSENLEKINGSAKNLSSSVNLNDINADNQGKMIEEIEEIEMNMTTTKNLECNKSQKIKFNNCITESVGTISHKLPQNQYECEISPKLTLLRNSKKKRSYSQSPNLFDDSLVVDTQECNILEQNLIDIDIEMFNDSSFIETNLSPVTANANKSRNIKEINVIAPSKFSHVVTTNKSLIWEEDTWYNSKIIPDNSKQYQTISTEQENNIQNYSKDLQTSPTSLTRNIDVGSLTKSRLEKLGRINKGNRETPDIVKSPIASIITFKSPRRLSTGSNKSEDDVIIESQSISSFPSPKKTRTRMKLESLRSHTLKMAGRTPIPPSALREEKPIDISTMKSMKLMVEKSIPSDCNSDNLNSKVLSDDCDSKNINQTYGTIENNKKNVPKELSIVKISLDKKKFQAFRRKVCRKKDISLALACEIFPTNTVAIGTRIINATGGSYYNIRKKLNNIDNGIYNDKKLNGVAIFWGRRVYYLSFENVQESTYVSLKERIALLTTILSTPELNVRCFATKEVYKTLYKCCGLSPCCKFLDPLTADWLLDPENLIKSYGNLVTEHLPEGLTLLNRLEFSVNNSGPGMNVKSSTPAEIRACTEAILTWYLLQSLKNKLEILDPDLLKTFRDVEMGTLSILSRLELTGIGVNLAALQELSEVIRQQLNALEEKAFALAGKKFNFASSKSVAQVLGMEKGKKICTNKAALERCKHPISKIVMNWRKLSSTHSKIICPFLNLAELHSRIYSNCIMNTVTGRVSMHEPNLQNVPRDFNSADNSFVISVRMAFIPALGNVLVSADYCQLELRILAHFSKDSKLCSILKKPGDVFKNIAARWYNTSETNIDDTMRQRTKQLCYGMIYGMGVKTLAETLQVEEDEARKFLETFMNAYPTIKEWLCKTVEIARIKGFITTLMKRRRILPGINSEIMSERRQAERQAINSTIQGSAADISKMAMILVDEKLKQEYPNMPMVLPEMPVKRKLRRNSETLPRGAYLVLQLHDELIYEVNALDLNQVVRIIKKNMEDVYSLAVPLPVKVKTGSAWGDLTEYDFDTADKSIM